MGVWTTTGSSASGSRRTSGCGLCSTPLRASSASNAASTSSAALFAISCSASRASTSTWPSRATDRRSPGRWPRSSAGASSLTTPSAPRWSNTATTNASTSSPLAASTTRHRPRCRRSSLPRSRTTSFAATSPSTLWRPRWPARRRAASSTRSRASGIWRQRRSACSTTNRSWTTRRGSSGRCATRIATASSWRSTPPCLPARRSRPASSDG